MTTRRRLDLLYGGHLALVAALGIGWMLRAIETANAASTTSFSTSPVGRALALIAMVGGISAIAAVLVVTVQEYRDGRAILLFVLLGCAIAWRRGPALFDIVYVLAATSLAAHWFSRGRRVRSDAETSPGAPGGASSGRTSSSF